MRDEITGFFLGRIPDGWFTDAADIEIDGDEVLVVGTIPAPDVPEGEADEVRRAAEQARIQEFREETREKRVGIARDAETAYRRKVSWGARCGETKALFTHLSVPAMTRLRMRERKVLDTLIESGVARSRSDALAWCVRLVARNEGDWIGELRSALEHVEEARRTGPEV